VVHVRVCEENRVDSREILYANSGPSKPADQNKPVREDRIDEDVEGGNLQKKRGVPDECNSKLLGRSSDRFVLLADGSLQSGLTDEFESEAEGRTGNFRQSISGVVEA
jgi:hypothetical protein